jgi:sulfate permease, SulP family
VALAAIAIPSQLATAHLAGFPPIQGFAACAAGSIGFALLGANRHLTVCADSTIAPIFAGGLAHLAATGTSAYFGVASAFALMVGAILLCAGLFRRGWIADLVSMPVTTGFLAGIAVHIIVSQLPFLTGISAPRGDLLQKASEIATRLDEANPLALILGAIVFGAALGAEWISPRIPGTLIGIGAATAAVLWFKLEGEGVAVLGAVSGEVARFRLPPLEYRQLIESLPLAFVTAAVIMVQSAATTRAFPGARGASASVNRDFSGIGAANILAGLAGTFAVDASPPLTGTVAEAGGRSKFAGLTAAAVILALAVYGPIVLAHVPQVALAGTLMFVAIKLVRACEIVSVMPRASGEFLLILATFTAVILLPVATGVAAGIVLSLLHGMWSMIRPPLSSKGFRGFRFGGLRALAIREKGSREFWSSPCRRRSLFLMLIPSNTACGAPCAGAPRRLN